MGGSFKIILDIRYDHMFPLTEERTGHWLKNGISHPLLVEDWCGIEPVNMRFPP